MSQLISLNQPEYFQFIVGQKVRINKEKINVFYDENYPKYWKQVMFAIDKVGIVKKPKNYALAGVVELVVNYDGIKVQLNQYIFDILDEEGNIMLE